MTCSRSRVLVGVAMALRRSAEHLRDANARVVVSIALVDLLYVAADELETTYDA